MKFKEEVEMFVGGIFNYALLLLAILCVMLIFIPFSSLYSAFKVKGSLEKYDFLILLIIIPASAFLLIIRKLLKNRKAFKEMKIDKKN